MPPDILILLSGFHEEHGGLVVDCQILQVYLWSIFISIFIYLWRVRNPMVPSKPHSFCHSTT